MTEDRSALGGRRLRKLADQRRGGCPEVGRRRMDLASGGPQPPQQIARTVRSALGEGHRRLPVQPFRRQLARARTAREQVAADDTVQAVGDEQPQRRLVRDQARGRQAVVLERGQQVRDRRPVVPVGLGDQPLAAGAHGKGASSPRAVPEHRHLVERRDEPDPAEGGVEPVLRCRAQRAQGRILRQPDRPVVCRAPNGNVAPSLSAEEKAMRNGTA